MFDTYTNVEDGYTLYYIYVLNKICRYLKVFYFYFSIKENCAEPRGGTRDIYWWGCALAHQKKGVLGAGTAQKGGF